MCSVSCLCNLCSDWCKFRPIWIVNGRKIRKFQIKNWNAIYKWRLENLKSPHYTVQNLVPRERSPSIMFCSVIFYSSPWEIQCIQEVTRHLWSECWCFKAVSAATSNEENQFESCKWSIGINSATKEFIMFSIANISPPSNWPHWVVPVVLIIRWVDTKLLDYKANTLPNDIDLWRTNFHIFFYYISSSPSMFT